jgi:hypothetical protein
MEVSARSLAKGAVNWVIGPLGMEVVRKDQHDWSDTRNFIPIGDTLAGAKRAGLSVGDYIDTVLNNIPGATQSTVDEMEKLGVFAAPVKTVLEIGPGSGRYLEKTVAVCSPGRYEIYETSQPWASFLVGEYGVIEQPTDGSALASTPDASCDLVHAHKVFSSIPFMPSVKYWGEMVRVARGGAHIVFDIMTEACLDPGTLRKWAASGIDNGAYPAAMPRKAATDFFTASGCTLVGSFLVPMGHGHTETFVFRKV